MTSQFIKYLICVALRRLGILRLVVMMRRILNKGQVRILTYHGVDNFPDYLNMFTPPAHFEAQLECLKKHSLIIPLNDAIRLIEEKIPLSKDVFVITLDDGYRDNYTHGFTIAKRLEVPMTIFLTTQRIDDQRPTLFYTLMLVVHHSRTPAISLPEYGLPSLPTLTGCDKSQALRQLNEFSKPLNLEEREKFSKLLIERAGLQREDPIFKDRMLSWDQIREMDRQAIDFGAHSVHHPVLSLLDPQTAEFEMRESGRRIEKELNHPVTCFAYPYGGKQEVSEEIIRIAQKSGYRSAVVLYDEKHDPSSLHKLGRIMVGMESFLSPWGTFSESIFLCEALGILNIFRKAASIFG